MPRSFRILFLFVVAVLATFVVEIATMSLAIAQEPWSPRHWTPFEMTVKPGTCKAQYDGVTAEVKIKDGFLGKAMFAASVAVEDVCSQYNRNMGLPRPMGCDSNGTSISPGEYNNYDYHPYCYCKVEATVECIEAGEKAQTPSRRSGSSLSSAFDKATELVEAVGRAIYYARAHPDALSRVRFDLDGSPRSGTRYRTSSGDADALYTKGMRAYAKTSHTDAETLEALTSFSACIEDDPTHVPCLWELGWVLHVNGHYGQTKILWDRVKQIDPNHEQVDAELRRLESKL